MKTKQPWLHSALADSLFVIGPPFYCVLAVMLFPGFFQETNNEVSLEAWVVLILLIDVGHVYSTLFRTYFDRQSFNRHRQLFLYAPLMSFLVSLMLYALGSLVFWRVLAYLAVFHFVRQQYGLMRLYARHENSATWEYWVDKLMIYGATLYPLLYWHLEDERNFNWFLAGDFLAFPLPRLLPFLTGMYSLLLVVFIVKELRFSIRHKRVNVPKNLIVAGTALSWYLGIVHFNGDLTFTLFNVVSHGIPYMALVWFYGRKQQQATSVSGSGLLKYVYGAGGIVVFLGIIFGLAFVEEGLWDRFVWQEHERVFSGFAFLPALQDGVLLPFLIPFLALPQLTHYILDGFIWKVSKDKTLK